MSVRLKTSNQKTFGASPNAIGLPAERCGLSQPDLLDGLTNAPSGQARARASRSRKLASEPEQMIQGICGRTFIVSSVPAGPLSSWESRLRERMAMVGSTESALIWREKTTPAGVSISRLAPSTRHTNGTGCTGSLWTTVSARDWKDSAGMSATGTNPDGSHRQRLDHPPRQMVSYSPTPTVADVQGGRKHRSGTRKNEPLLNGLMLAYSATPRASDGEKGGPNMSFGAGRTLLPTQMYSYNPTPRISGRGESLESYQRRKAVEYEKYPGKGIGGLNLDLLQTTYETAHGGLTPNGSSVQSTARRGAPNPAFPFWLMGFPDEWVSGALAAMQSRPSSRRK